MEWLIEVCESSLYTYDNVILHVNCVSLLHNSCSCITIILQDCVSEKVSPLPSNRHHRRCDDRLEGKGENYQVCSVQYCVQLLSQCDAHTYEQTNSSLD